MKISILIAVATFLAISAHVVHATDADSTTITITAQTAGPTPFINKLNLVASQTDVLTSIQFKIMPKSGSVTRPLSGTYSHDYLVAQGYLDTTTNQITLPVYGLYAGYANTVTLTYNFVDGSSKQASTTITTATFTDPCGYDHPTVLQARTSTTALSYDYMLVKGSCSDYSPAIIDTDGALRWVGTTGYSTYTGTFFDNAVYIAANADIYRNDLDGTYTHIGTYTSAGITDFHHNIDRGKVGIILDADTPSYLESVNVEIDAATGAILKTWNLAQIISAAMTAGGDDPSQFVYSSPTDWFHNNAVTYNRADDSVIISSRENFLICLDYETDAIKWILGDPTKKWYQFPSLRKYAITLSAGSLPPIGQHAPSITYDQDIMVFDNGEPSFFQMPVGATRNYASPRKYQLDLTTKTATEVWNYPMNESVYSPICGSVYEDAPLNYLIDYADVNGFTAPTQYGQILGLDAAGEKVFYYQYPTKPCAEAFNSLPLHLEDTRFPTVGPQALNISTRGTVSTGDNALIAGFIVTGTQSKTVVLRALAPVLTPMATETTTVDPVLSLYDSSGTMIAQNDNWQTDIGAGYIVTVGLAPKSPSESALLETLAPGAYTAVVTNKNASSGLGLVEAYDLTPALGTLANISTRGEVGTDENVLISGFIIGDVSSSSVIIRALGPSLAPQVSGALADPYLTIYDQNGTQIAFNDSWQEDPSAADIQQKGLAPANPAEAATALFLPAGSYTAIVRGAGDTTGIALVEVYDIQ